jgi:hypothetical protein
VTRRQRRTLETAEQVKGHHVGADGSTVFSRSQAARFLGLRLSAIKAAEQRGALRPFVLQGVHLFSREELERYRSSTKHGELAAKCFASFAVGATAAQVVIEHSVPPELARHLLVTYGELAETVICAAPKGTRKAWEAAFGVVLTPELVLRAVELAARTPSIRAKLLGQPAA